MTNVILCHIRGWLVAPSVFCLVALATASISAQAMQMPMKPMNKSMPMKMNKSAPMVTGTEPSNGAELINAPKKIGVSFMMPMRITVLKLTTETGETIPVELGQQKPAREFTVAIPALDPDQYSVEWQARGQDGHAMSGSFEFSVVGKD